MNIYLRSRHLQKEYGMDKNRVTAVSDATAEFEEGAFYVIIGRSGCGKSTLLRMLGGLERPTAGDVYYNEKDIYRMPDEKLSQLRNEQFGFVFQMYNLIPELTAYDNIALPCWLLRKQKRKEIIRLAETLGIEERLTAYPEEMSGGQQQRVALARALINQPRIIFADEPTGNLDRENRNIVMDYLRNYCTSQNKTIIMVSHDEASLKYADRILRMDEGVLSV